MFVTTENDYEMCFAIIDPTHNRILYLDFTGSSPKFFGKSTTMPMVIWERKTSISNDVENRTWMSTFVLFLIKSWFLPISINDEKIIFKVFSWKTFFHCFIYFGYLILANVIISIFTSINFNYENYFPKGGSYALNFSSTVMGCSTMMSVIMPLIISHGLTTLTPALILRKDLKVPPKGYRNILGIIH